MGSIEVQIEGQHREGVRCSLTLPTADETSGLPFIIMPLAGYLVAPDMYLNIVFTVEKVTGSGSTAKVEPIAGTDKIAIVNYGLMSMWKTIEMEINQKPIIPINTHVGYTSLIRVYEELDVQARESQLALSGWDPDAPGSHENFTISATDNAAFTRRHVLIQDAKDVEFFGPVMLGPLRQNKAFVDDAEIVLTFNRAPAEFFLVGDLGAATATTNFRVTIKKAVLYINRLKMRSGTRLARQISYNYTSYENRHFVVPANGQIMNIEILNSAPCPNRVFAAMVSQKAYFGDFKKNPHLFPTNLIQSVYLKKDQMTTIPAEIFKTELGTSAAGTKYLYNTGRFYTETMEVLNDKRWLSHSSIGISMRSWLFGTLLLGFDMRTYPGGSAPPGDVILRLEATFHENFTEQILLMVIFEYDRRLTIPTGAGRNEVTVD